MGPSTVTVTSVVVLLKSFLASFSPSTFPDDL